MSASGFTSQPLALKVGLMLVARCRGHYASLSHLCSLGGITIKAATAKMTMTAPKLTPTPRAILSASSRPPCEVLVAEEAGLELDIVLPEVDEDSSVDKLLEKVELLRVVGVTEESKVAAVEEAMAVEEPEVGVALVAAFVAAA